MTVRALPELVSAVVYVIVRNCRSIGVYVRVTAVTGMSSVALCDTCGRCHNVVVIMTGCLNLICNVRISAMASMGCITLLRTGGRSYNYCAMIVAGCRNLIINVRISAMASMGCITLFSTSGRSYNYFIVMTESIYHGLSYENLVTCRAMLTFGKTRLSTCSCNSLVNYFGMSLSSNNRILIGVAAGDTGIGGESFLCTCGRSHDLFITMSKRISVGNTANGTYRSLGTGCYTAAVAECINPGIYVSARTVLAYVSGISTLSTCGSYYGRNIIVSDRIYVLGTAYGTYAGFLAICNTALVSGSRDFVADVRVGALRACVSSITVLKACGLLNHCYVVVRSNVTLCNITYRTSLGCITGSIYPAMTECASLGVATVVTSAGSSTGSLSIVMTLLGLAYSSTVKTNLRSSTSSILPIMTYFGNLICNIYITAIRTGIRSITYRRTGRSDYYSLIIVSEFINLVCNVAVAARTNVGGITPIGTCRSCYVSLMIMTESIYYGLSNENLITYGAMLTFGKSRLGTGSCNRGINDLGMAESIYHCLRYKNLVTYRTMFTFGKSCLGTGSCNCGVNNLNMSQSIYYGLRYKNLVTYGAMLACGKTGFGAGRSYCLVCHLGMTESIYYGLRYKNLITYGAMRACGKTGFSTCRSYCLIRYLGMTESIYHSLCCENLVTY